MKSDGSKVDIADWPCYASSVHSKGEITVADELSYVMTTPYTLAKSRTGGILSRLFSRVDLELIAVQVLTPDQKTIDTYAASLLKYSKNSAMDNVNLLSNYVLENMSPSNGRAHRVAIFLFRGENAVSQLMDQVGAIFPENRSVESITGETIRDTYADLVRSANGDIVYFEPAVLTPRSRESAEANLKIFTSFMKNQDNVVHNLTYDNPEDIQKTLVIIKPDNWKVRSTRPGSIVDMLSRTGLRIVGMKVYQMSTANALEFYGEVLETLESKVAPRFAVEAVATLEDKFSMKFEASSRSDLSKSFGTAFSQYQLGSIVEFMSGYRPEDVSKEKMDDPGTVKSMILVYEGKNCINEIRSVLGPTDPSSAPGGTIRRDFGSNIMVNAVHASDSAESAKREFEIVRIHENDFLSFVEEYYS